MKNTVKILNKINRVVLAITLILYTTIFLGLYSQIVLGITQVFSAILLIPIVTKVSNKHKIRLSIYFIIITIYGLSHLLGTLEKLDDFIILIIIVIPMSIAGYFTFILESIKREL